MKEIPLTQGKVALVDDEDFEMISKFKWFAKRNKNSSYAVRNGIKRGCKVIIMHRIIMGVPSDLEIDHIDGNGLNNQKHNLRIVTHEQNCQNQINRKEKGSVYPGVCKAHGLKWKARLVRNGVCKHIGCFDTEEEARSAYLNTIIIAGETPIELCPVGGYQR